MKFVCLVITCLLSLTLTPNALAYNHVELFYQAKNANLIQFAKTKDSSTLLSFYHRCLTTFDIYFLCDIRFDDDFSFNTAVRLQKFEIANDFLVFKIKTGFSYTSLQEMRQNQEYNQFFETSTAQSTIDNYDLFWSDFKKQLDITYCYQIITMIETDQMARTVIDEEYLYGKTGSFEFLDDSIKALVSTEIIKRIDSINFNNLIRLIELKGYPTNSKTWGGLGFLVIHYYRPNDYLFSKSSGLGSHQIMDSIMLKAVIEGKENNRNYAYVKDSDCQFGVGVKSTYGVFCKKDKNDEFIAEEILDLKSIDKRRAEIYLPPLWVDAMIYGFKLPEGYTY